MKRYYALSAIGRDRPGIVAEVAGLIFECGGNLEDSRMTRLGEEFALLILLSGTGEEFQFHLFAGCKRLEWEKHISIFLTPVEEPKTGARGRESTEHYELTTTGLDHMGIVYHVSRLLADQGINIADMQTRAAPSPESGSPIFSMKILLEVPRKVNSQNLLHDLNRLAEKLAIDISLKKVEAEG